MKLIFLLLGMCVHGLPNIVLLFPDQWRSEWNSMGNLKANISTPIFEKIAKNGVQFRNAHVASPLCAPSRGCLATGKEYPYSGITTNRVDLPPNQRTFYQFLQENGYWTMTTGKDDLTMGTGVGVNGSYRAKQLGFSDQGRRMGKWASFNGYPNATDPFGVDLMTFNESLWTRAFDCMANCCNPNAYDSHECPRTLDDVTVGIDFSQSWYGDDWVANQSIDLLKRRPQDMPFFLQANFVGPHPPFVILNEMNASVANRELPYPVNCSWPVIDTLVIRRDYVAEIENLDRLFGRVIKYLEESDALNDTVICVSSDHGELLGDYDLVDKSKPWGGAMNVPLICADGSALISNETRLIQKGVVIETPVSNMDLAATILDLAKALPLVNASGDSNMTSVSLKPFLTGQWTDEDNDYRQWVLSGLHRFRVAIEHVNASLTWKYICCTKNECPGRSFGPPNINNLTKLLFNVKEDPFELTDLANQYPDIVEKMNGYVVPPGYCDQGGPSKSILA